MSSKQCRSWSDAAKSGVWSGSTLFATYPAASKHIYKYLNGLFQILDKVKKGMEVPEYLVLTR